MLSSLNSTTAPRPLAWQVRHLISQRKRVHMRALRPSAHLVRELHFDLVDVVDIILAVEQQFHLTVPDEVPLHTVGDLVTYVSMHHATPAR